MANVQRGGSGVPRVQLRSADDLVERIVSLKADADARGLDTLAYFLETARIEAQCQTERIAAEQAAGMPIPDAVWRAMADRE